VIGELIGGILLGPSLLGKSHAWASTIFPDFTPGIKCANLSFAFQPSLYIASQLGLIFFMFYLGLEIQPSILIGYWKSAVPIAVSSIVCPFLLGVGFSYLMYPLSHTTTDFTSFCLFTGCAMSFTALPVLGRILTGTSDGKGLTSKIGMMSVAISAVDDLLAWLSLALILVYYHGQSGLVGLTDVLLLIGFLLVQLFPIRWGLQRLHAYFVKLGREEDPLLMMALFVGLLLSAWVAEVIDVHALFGSFVFGLVVPKTGKLVEDLCPRIELLIVNVFVPLYFAYSGLNTQIGALNSAALVFAMLFQVFLASVGKIIPVSGLAYFAYKKSGLFSIGLGFLVNTRGLVSLIVANIGRSEGIFNPIVFSSLVLVNVLTTVMTPPIFYTLYEKHGLNEQLEAYSHSPNETEMTSVKVVPRNDASDANESAPLADSDEKEQVREAAPLVGTRFSVQDPMAPSNPDRSEPLLPDTGASFDADRRSNLLTVTPSKDW